jgi:dihydroxy-acid dehydratase
MLAGCFQDRAIDVSNLADLVGMAQRQEISAEDREDFIEEVAPTCGACAGLFTANSMNCMAEALGLALPGNGTIPAVYGKRRELARHAGRRLMELIEEGRTPRSVLTRESFENAITVDMAIGGSSNTILHLMAIAAEAGVDLTWTPSTASAGARRASATSVRAATTWRTSTRPEASRRS